MCYLPAAISIAACSRSLPEVGLFTRNASRTLHDHRNIGEPLLIWCGLAGGCGGRGCDVVIDRPPLQ